MERTLRDRIFHEELFIHEEAVYNYLFQLTREASVAYDLTQDTFVRAFQKIDQFEPGTNGKAWLSMIAKNIFINEYRKKKRRGETELDERTAFHLRDEAHALAEFVDLRNDGKLEKLFGDELHKALATLTDEQRSILFMKDLYDYSEKDIAESHELELNTAKGKIRRVRIELIKRLSSYAEAQFGIVNTRNLG